MKAKERHGLSLCSDCGKAFDMRVQKPTCDHGPITFGQTRPLTIKCALCQDTEISFNMSAGAEDSVYILQFEESLVAVADKALIPQGWIRTKNAIARGWICPVCVGVLRITDRKD